MPLTLFYKGNVNVKVDGDADQYAGKLWAEDWTLIADVVNRPIIETGQTNFVEAIKTLSKPRKPSAGMYRVFSKAVPQFILPTQTNDGPMTVDFYGTPLPLTYYDGSPLSAGDLTPYVPLTLMWNGTAFYITRSSLSVVEADMSPTAIIGTSFGYTRTKILADIDTTVNTPSYIISPTSTVLTYILFMTNMGYGMVMCENNTITSANSFLKVSTIGTSMVISNEHDIIPIAIIGTNAAATDTVLFTPTNVTDFTSGYSTIQSAIIPNYIMIMNDTIFGDSFGTSFIDGSYKKIAEFGNGTAIWHDQIANKMRLGNNLLMNGSDYYNQKMQTRTPLQTIATNIVNHKPLAIINDGHLFNHIECGDANTQTSAINKQTFDNLGSVPFPVYFNKTYEEFVVSSPLFYEDGNYKGFNYHVEDNMDVGVIFSYGRDNILCPMINGFFDFGTTSVNGGYIKNGYASKMLLPTKTTAGQSMIGVGDISNLILDKMEYFYKDTYNKGCILASKTKIHFDFNAYSWYGVLMTGVSTHIGKDIAFAIGGTSTGKCTYYLLGHNSDTFTVSDFVDSANLKRIILPGNIYTHRYGLSDRDGAIIVSIDNDDTITLSGVGGFAFGFDMVEKKKEVIPGMDYGNIVSCMINPTTGRPNILFDDSLYLYWDGSDYVIKAIDMKMSTPLDKRTTVDTNGNQISLMKNGALKSITADGIEILDTPADDIQGGIYLVGDDVYKDGVSKYVGTGPAFGVSTSTGYGVYCYSDGVYFENGDVFVANAFTHIELSTIKLANNGTNVLVQYNGDYTMVKADGTIDTTTGLIDDPIVLVPHETCDYWFVYNTTTNVYETFPASATVYTNMLNGFGEVIKPDMIAYTNKHVIVAHEDWYYFRGDNTNFVIKENIPENVSLYLPIARRVGLDLTYSTIDTMFYTYKGTLRAIGIIGGVNQTAMIVPTNPFKGNVIDIKSYVTTDSFGNEEIYGIRGGYLRGLINTKFGDLTIGYYAGGASANADIGYITSLGQMVDGMRGNDSKFITKHGEIFNDRYSSSVGLDTSFQGVAYSTLRTQYDSATYGDPIADNTVRYNNACHVYTTTKGYVIYQGTLSDIPGNAACELGGTALDQHNNGFPFRRAIAGFNKIYAIDKDYKVRVFSNTQTWEILDTAFNENAIEICSLYNKEGLTVLAGDKKVYAISEVDAYLSGNLDEKTTFTLVSDPTHVVIELQSSLVTTYLTEDNRLFICGLGANGRLASGGVVDRATFEEIFAPYVIRRVILGLNTIAIVRDDGEVRWGGVDKYSPYSTATTTVPKTDAASIYTGFVDQHIDNGSEIVAGFRNGNAWYVKARNTYYTKDMDQDDNPYRSGFVIKTHIGWRLIQGKGSLPLNEDLDDRFISDKLTFTPRGTPIATTSGIHKMITFTHQGVITSYEFVIDGTGSYLQEAGTVGPAMIWDYDTAKFGYDIRDVYGDGDYCLAITHANELYYIGTLGGHTASHFIRVPVVGTVLNVKTYSTCIGITTTTGVYTITNTTDQLGGTSRGGTVDDITMNNWLNCNKTEGTLNEHILDVVTKGGNPPDLTVWMKPWHQAF